MRVLHFLAANSDILHNSQDLIFFHQPLVKLGRFEQVDNPTLLDAQHKLNQINDLRPNKLPGVFANDLFQVRQQSFRDKRLHFCFLVHLQELAETRLTLLEDEGDVSLVGRQWHFGFKLG